MTATAARTDRLIADILFDVANEPVVQADPAVDSWAMWFDILRERVAASKGQHPLRWADLIENR